MDLSSIQTVIKKPILILKEPFLHVVPAMIRSNVHARKAFGTWFKTTIYLVT
jgi:hypothetical protein